MTNDLERRVKSELTRNSLGEFVPGFLIGVAADLVISLPNDHEVIGIVGYGLGGGIAYYEGMNGRRGENHEKALSGGVAFGAGMILGKMLIQVLKQYVGYQNK